MNLSLHTSDELSSLRPIEEHEKRHDTGDNNCKECPVHCVCFLDYGTKIKQIFLMAKFFLIYFEIYIHSKLKTPPTRLIITPLRGLLSKKFFRPCGKSFKKFARGVDRFRQEWAKKIPASARISLVIGID